MEYHICVTHIKLENVWCFGATNLYRFTLVDNFSTWSLHLSALDYKILRYLREIDFKPMVFHIFHYFLWSFSFSFYSPHALPPPPPHRHVHAKIIRTLLDLCPGEEPLIFCTDLLNWNRFRRTGSIRDLFFGVYEAQTFRV